MKKLFLLPAILLAGVLTAQDGIQFEKGNWADILSTARAENKLIFMDAYTTWCGPCKMMTRDVFPDSEVGAFFNEHFVNVKMDMEKGEGLDLANEYSVRAYPSLLFIDPDGMLVHRVTGYHDVEQFIEVGRAALNPGLQLSALRKQFEDGDRDPDFLYQYAYASYAAYDGSHVPVAEAYLETQDDWSTPENMEFVFTFAENANSPLFDYLVENRTHFQEYYGKENVIGKVQSIILNALQGGEATPDQVEKLYEKAFPEEAGKLSGHFRMNYYRMAHDYEGFAKAAVRYFEEYPSEDYYELNNVAWTFYEYVEEPRHLQVALTWAQKSVEMSDEYFNNDTLAALYYKLGMKKKARRAAQYAIKLAKQNGEDPSGTEVLLAEIEKM